MLLLTLLASAAAEEACAEPQSEPRIVIGCWQLLERHADESRAVDTLQAYFDAGFTAYDTADIYGRSETLIGKLRERGRAVARLSSMNPGGSRHRTKPGRNRGCLRV